MLGILMCFLYHYSVIYYKSLLSYLKIINVQILLNNLNHLHLFFWSENTYLLRTFINSVCVLRKQSMPT